MDSMDDGSIAKPKAAAPRRTSSASDPAYGEAGPATTVRGDRALEIIGDQRVVVTEEDVR